jgi:hypothetical protein
LVVRAAKFAKSGSRLLEQGRRSCKIPLGLAVYATRFPDCRDPWSALLHAGETFRVIDSPARLIELIGLGQGDG